jgi:signal transduction histidine kinase
MHSKVYFVVILFLVIIFSPFQTKAITNDVIKIAGDENYPPYEFVDKNGYYRGFNVDIMKAISVNLGIDIDIVPMKWQDALNALESKEIDVIQGMTRSRDREEKFAFTEAIVKNSQAIFVRSETDNIFEPASLNGSTVAIQAGDISKELMEEMKQVRNIIYNNQEQAIRALLKGEVDAFIGNKITGTYIVQNMKVDDRVKIVGEPMYPVEYASAALKGNDEVLKLLNEGLENIKRNGEYEKIYKKWFGEYLTDNSVVLKRLIIVISITLVFVVIVIAFVFYWNRSLKRIVAVKTSELEAANARLKREQERLRYSNKLRGQILENILDGIIVFSKAGEVLVANSAARQLLHLSNEEGHKIQNIKFNNNAIYEGYLQAAQGWIWNKCFEWQKDNGETLNIDCGIYPIKDIEETVENIIIVLHDYTESQLLEDAKEYDKLKTEFFANISHELKTPLSIIFASAQLLELNGNDNNISNLKGAIGKSVGTIRQNINRLTRLINNIIDATKADAGFLELELKNYNIVNIVEEVTMSTVNLIQNKGISVEFDTDVEERIIACDIDKVERIILNLLSNSVKFTPVGGSIFVKIMDGEKVITISVRDTGIGIPKDKQEIIFERFRQVDKSISRNHEGSGIGLSLVKSLAELHGGSIKVESSYGQGTEFIIKLPVVQLQDILTNYDVETFNRGKAEMEFSDIYL